MTFQHLVDSFRPLLLFHPHETYFPISIDRYLRHSTLTEDVVVVEIDSRRGDGDDGRTKRRSSPSSFWNVGTLTTANICTAYTDAAATTLRLKRSHRARAAGSQSDDAPMYARVSETNSEFIISYTFLYAFNEPYRVLRFWEVGAHDCDIEHVTMRIDRDTRELTHVFFSAHGSADGLWLDASSVSRVGSRPLVYVAVGSHATYPSAGTYVRIFGLANDVTSADGYILDTNRVIVIDEQTEWN